MKSDFLSLKILTTFSDYMSSGVTLSSHFCKTEVCGHLFFVITILSIKIVQTYNLSQVVKSMILVSGFWKIFFIRIFLIIF